VVAKSRGDIAKGLATGNKLEAFVRAAVLSRMRPGSRQRDGTPQARLLRNLDRHAGIARVQSEAAKAAGLPVDKVIAK